MADWAPGIFAVLALAMLIDALFGEPRWLYRHLPHPVVMMGRMIEALERHLRTEGQAKARAERAGLLLVALLLAVTLSLAVVLAALFKALPFGFVGTALLISSFLAYRSLDEHVGRVALGLEEDLDAGRRAVSMIVGRDPAKLDEAGVSRAAIESLAENLADGVIAPLFWASLFGLPGIAAYKAINTADSMIGHMNARYRHFGRAAARLDDLVNWLPARLTALLILAICALFHRARLGQAAAIVRQDAGRHRSPNAGYPEAALAGTLDLALSGPRSYDGRPSDEPWIGRGRADLGPADIRAALALVRRVVWLLAGILLGMTAIS